MTAVAECNKNVYPSQERVIVVPDVHGDYDALYWCLFYAAQVIDENWKWKGGNTWLVMLGDLVDRNRPGFTFLDEKGWGLGEIPGEEIIILEKLYELDQQARRHGGRVFKNLGNHEIMNLMQQDYTYATPNAKTPNRRENIRKALGECGIFGVLQIGTSLFAHGGVVEATFSSLPEDANFFTEVQKQTREALQTNTKKEDVGEALGSILWDRTWSSKQNVNCTRFAAVMNRLRPYLAELGFHAAANGNLKMFVAHSVQSHKTSGYVPVEVVENGKHVIKFGGKLEKLQGPQGPNALCDGSIWCTDIGMSRAFRSAPNSLSKEEAWAAQPAVLEILDHGKTVQVCVCKDTLPYVQPMNFTDQYLASLGYKFNSNTLLNVNSRLNYKQHE